MTFEELGLLPELLKAVAEAGYTEPTPIQAQAIPVVLEGKDVMGGAQTGTGKTAGFVLPLLQRLARHASNSPSPARHPVRALILTPTRELAMQVHESVQTYGKYVPLRDLVVYGGVDIKPQTEALRRGVEIVVATPGRLLDHVEQKSVGFNFVEVLVLDEADRMLDMGFIPDIKRILALLPKERQSLLFSATFSEEIKKLADSMLRAPVLIEVARRNALTDTVTHRIHPVAQDDKRALLAHLLKRSNASQVLVFVGTKFGASRLAHYLERQGINATAIHGDKSQQQRTEALEAFKSGTVRVLVATDVAARGLDIDDLPHVINYELPHVPEDYVHRIGRTGRAGKEGDATSLVCAEERGKLAEIEKLIKRQIEQVVIEGYEPEPSFYGAIEKGRRGRGGRKDEPRQEKESRREPREKRERREPREPRRVEPAKPKYPKLDFDPSKPYEPKVSSGETAAPEPKRSHHRPKRPVPALLGGLPKPEPEK
ncbi:MAG: ATP-dependent RNA helicase RhlE [Rhodocyclaceae bacterium]|nr:ATP-dependent RNA helicase RhlE [Rhodocyclaceae bacterium]CAG0943959.1 ATP-dependent RNA helicase DDX31/DBP7 [Gammaproteobacteria bacterium]